MADETSNEVLGLTAKIVSAHIGKHQVAVADLPGLIQSVYDTLATVGSVEPSTAPQAPAVPIRKSVFPDYIVCLEDGKKLKMLKRHLQNSYGMTPRDYRAKWGLPDDYPMVAPAYASKRSELAKLIGLGRRPASQDKRKAEEENLTAPEPAVTQVPARRARGSRG